MRNAHICLDVCCTYVHRLHYYYVFVVYEQGRDVCGICGRRDDAQ